jgi:hypothetical protein
MFFEVVIVYVLLAVVVTLWQLDVLCVRIENNETGPRVGDALDRRRMIGPLTPPYG